MATSKNKYISADLDFAETKIQNLKKWLDEHDYDSFIDRFQWRETKTGAIPITIATIESQQKNWRETAKEYLALLEVVDKLREAEEKKAAEVRGGGEIPDIMKRNNTNEE